MERKKVSVVIPCYNERENIGRLCLVITDIMAKELPEYEYEIVISDNDSVDGTKEILEELSEKDRRIKVIFNDQCYLQGFSMNNALMNATGDAVILMFADFQDPPELIPRYVKSWEDGYKIIPAVRTGSEESFFIYSFRRLFYFILRLTSGLRVIPHYNGTGCYDREFLELCRENMGRDFNMRMFVAKRGNKIKPMEFRQPARSGGKSSNQFFRLVGDASDYFIQNFSSSIYVYMIALSVLGVGIAALIALYYLVNKLVRWDSFEAGMAPVLILLATSVCTELFVLARIWGVINKLQVLVHPAAQPLAVKRNKRGKIVLAYRVFAAVTRFYDRYLLYFPILGYVGIFVVAILALVYLVLKLLHWQMFQLGFVPTLLLLSFLLAIQFTLSGILVRNLELGIEKLQHMGKPLVGVRRKVNFDD